MLSILYALGSNVTFATARYLAIALLSFICGVSILVLI